jgi:spore coat polysaccharide biosynthesis predicted glycosyltransferase SpsG
VLLSERSPHYESVKTFCNEHYNINHLAFTTAMAQLMSEHHIAIGAPGSTSWERACLGLPSIIIPIAENQCDIARNIANSGAAILLELDRITVEFDAVFDEICLRWQQYHEASLQLTDGLGAKRVTDEIEKLFA